MAHAWSTAIAFILMAIHCIAQEASLPLFPDIQRWGAGFHTGPIFAHSTDVQNTDGAYPKGLELLWSRQINNPDVWNICSCNPVTGIQLSYYDYDTKILGRSVNLAYLLEPQYRLASRMSIGLRTAAGLAYLTSPYHSVTNPPNQSYSMALSAYLTFGVGLEFQLTDKWSLETTGQYQHISNGGISQPNKGINWPTIGIVTAYRPDPRRLQRFETNRAWDRNGVRMDAGLFSMGKRVGGQPGGGSKRFLVMGLTAQAAWQVGRINNLTAGAELVWDTALADRLGNEGIHVDPWRGGALLGHEFILGRFLFSQRIGVYLHQAGDYYDPWYHSWGLTYGFNNHWSLGFNLRAHRHVADFSDFRLVYSF
jgi:hypothetical protein